MKHETLSEYIAGINDDAIRVEYVQEWIKDLKIVLLKDVEQQINETIDKALGKKFFKVPKKFASVSGEVIEDE